MDPLRLALRVLFAYVFALALIRASGTRSVKQGDAQSFVLAVILGDMFDDLFWAEVPAAQFVVAVSTLVLLQVVASLTLFRSGERKWRRQRAAGAPA